MKPHEVRPSVKKEKKSKMQGEKSTYLILRLRGLVRNKGACPISRCKKEKKQAQNGRPQRTLCRLSALVCVRGLCVPPTDFTTRTHRDSCSKSISCSHGDHSLGENKKEGPCKKYPSPKKIQPALSYADSSGCRA